MFKFCKKCGEMKQFSHKLHMIIQKRIEDKLNKPLDELPRCCDMCGAEE
jgi:hypothetical protein